MALVRVTALADFRANALSTTDVSTGQNITGPTATQSVYGVMNLTSASLGTTARVLALTIQAATASGFGSPSTVLSFLLSTVAGGEWAVPAGPGSISGFSVSASQLQWWRASWTMSTVNSTGGTWKALVSFGIK